MGILDRFKKNKVRTTPAPLSEMRNNFNQLNDAINSLPSRPNKLPRRINRPSTGKGRPVGSYKYFIPGKGRVDVYTWRKYLQSRKNFINQAARTQAALSKTRIMVNQPTNSQPYYPTSYGDPVPKVQPSLKQISILERTPLTVAAANNPMENFVELDFTTGQPVQRQRGNLW